MVFTVYVPSSVVNDVRVHVGALSVEPHKRILFGTSSTVPVTPAGTTPPLSFDHGESTTGEPCSAIPVSNSVIGAGGGTTVGVKVDVATCPRLSFTMYRTGVAVP